MLAATARHLTDTGFVMSVGIGIMYEKHRCLHQAVTLGMETAVASQWVRDGSAIMHALEDEFGCTAQPNA